MNILVIENEQNIRYSIMQCLTHAGFTPHGASNGLQALNLIKSHTYNAIIMDYMMPKKNGLSVCTFLRKEKNYIPILVVSAVDALESKINFLRSGADDYLTKPFLGSELIARIKALLRRPTTFHPSILTTDVLEINSLLQRVTRNNHVISLTKKEYSLLEYLFRFKNIIISRHALIEHVWNKNADPFSNTLEAHILSLRRKLGFKRNEYIKCISGRGYVFELQQNLHANSK